MSALPAVAILTVMLQQAPVPAVDESQQLLVAAVNHMNAQRLDSAALLLRRVVDAPTRPVDDRVRGWIMLAVVDYYRYGDSASAHALRQALILQPDFTAPTLERNHPEVGRLLAAERAARAPETAQATAQAAADSPALLDCLAQCTEGGRPPRFISFPNLQFMDGNAGVGVYERRLRTYLIFQTVISADGLVELETLQVTGGTARGMEVDIRRGLSQARFSPGRLNGMPVRTRVTLRFDFEAEGASWLKYSYKVLAR